MDQYHPLLEQIIYAFQDADIVSLIQSICGIDKLETDAHLYAGGISTMKKWNLKNRFNTAYGVAKTISKWSDRKPACVQKG